MDIARGEESAAKRPLRLWPGVAAALLLVVARFGIPIIVPAALPLGFLAEVVCGLAIVVWWAFFSRAPRLERWIFLPIMIVAAAAARPFLHISIATGMMGLMFFIYVIPSLSVVFVIWAFASRGLSDGLRRATMVASIVLACGVWTLLRTNGVTGGVVASDLAWRWSKTAEDRLLARTADEPVMLPAVVPAVAPIPASLPASLPTSIPAGPAARPLAPVEASGYWPGFRGPHRDGVIRGVRIETDWTRTPPVQLWRRPIGPGWSSFAAGGGLLYTQEQRGDDELVACYNATTGKPVWRHRDAARFWESNAGAGPRATPTLSNGRVYTFGATGIVNALDARTGAVVWSRNAAADTGVKVPGWGFASSPLVVDDEVIVATGGRLAAYEIASGKPCWMGPNGGDGYSSPELFTIGGVAQVVLMSRHGATSVAPADGKVLWEYEWPSDTRIVQPALTGDGDILMIALSAGGATGMRRLAVTQGAGGWTLAERWTSAGLKPYFNDFVVHEGHAFGFDGSILACIDLKDGQRKWKGGRYGTGQMMLLADQDLLLVLSDEGELALVGAGADQFREIARFPAIEGKTWNHPALAGDVLLVRNGQEMAAFRLPMAR